MVGLQGALFTVALGTPYPRHAVVSRLVNGCFHAPKAACVFARTHHTIIITHSIFKALAFMTAHRCVSPLNNQTTNAGGGLS